MPPEGVALSKADQLLSVAEITSRDTYINNKPVIGGLFDPRMGVLEPGLICPTDGLTYIDTPGYFGHIELARPVFSIQHIKDILKILRSICFKCSKILVNKHQHEHYILDMINCSLYYKLHLQYHGRHPILILYYNANNSFNFHFVILSQFGS